MIIKELDYHYIEGSYGGNQEWFFGPAMKLGGCGAEIAKTTIRRQIDKGLPIPMLMLKHRKKKFKDYEWHWFIVNGYKYSEDAFFIKAVTYSNYEWLNLDEFWDTGHSNKGGLVVFD